MEALEKAKKQLKEVSAARKREELAHQELKDSFEPKKKGLIKDISDLKKSKNQVQMEVENAEKELERVKGLIKRNRNTLESSENALRETEAHQEEAVKDLGLLASKKEELEAQVDTADKELKKKQNKAAAVISSAAGKLSAISEEVMSN